jgi:hypothetical protein
LQSNPHWLKTMKWKNCSLDLEQFNCPAADTYLFLGHHSPVFDLVCNSVTTRPICGVQALNESVAAPKLDRVLGDEALGPFDSFAVVSTNERFESYDMPVVADEVGAVLCHPKSPLPDGLIVCLLFGRSQKGLDFKRGLPVVGRNIGWTMDIAAA